MILLQEPIQAVNDSIPSFEQELQMLKTMPFDDFVGTVVDSLVKFSINLAIAILVFYVGKFVIRKIFNLLRNVMNRREVDRSLMTFVLSLVKMVLYFILIVTVIGILGIETSSFIALFGAAGVAMGMALSGTLQNFAGGVLILLLKPYKVGDYIETQGYAGYVREIQIFHTIISTYDNKSIIIPNGGLSTGSINNWSREEYRRVEWSVAISYGDDVEAARNAIMKIFDSDSRIVRNYIEDDREMRLNSGEISDTDEENTDETGGEAETRRPWYVRMFGKHHPVSKTIGHAHKIVQRRKVVVEKELRRPVVIVDALNSSSVDLKARAWARTEYYWPLFYEINERIYNELPQSGIHFPFPQMDVHVKES